jgi:hypothetical protein
MSGRSLEVGRVTTQDGHQHVYTEKDMEIVGKFRNIIQTKRDVAAAIDVHPTALVSKKEFEDGSTEEMVIMSLDRTAVQTMAQMAFNMYLFYGQEPRIRVAMDQLLQNSRNEDEEQRKLEVEQLEGMWDQP